MAIRQVNHVAISTPDLQRALGFYRDLMGFADAGHFEVEDNEVANRATALRGICAHGALLRAGNVYLELFEFHAPSPAKMDPRRPVCDHGITHIALEVNDLTSEHRRLQEAGVHFQSPPQAWPGGGVFVYARDPDGNVVELIEHTGPQDQLWLGEPART